MIDFAGIAWRELLSAFIGTFVGAYVAFKLEHRMRERELTNQRGTDGNLALLTLLQMFNTLRQFQKEVIATAPERQGRWFNMKVTFPQSEKRLGFEPSKLAFLFEYDDKNLLPEVLLEEGRFNLAIEMINRRAHLMLEKIFPLLAGAGIQRGATVSNVTIERILGPALATEADQLTESIVMNVNEDVVSLRKTFEKLRLALVKLLPGQKFIRVQF